MNLIHSIKRFVATAAVGAIALGVVPWAAADVKTFVPGSGVWHDENNWNPSGIPTASDRVVIPEGNNCTVNEDAEADTIVVEPGSQLIIAPGVTLTLDNDDDHTATDPDHSIVDGLVVLQGEDAVLFFTANSHSLSGEGRIWGLHNGARIEIEADIIFRSYLATTGEGIRGQLVIKGRTGGNVNGTFSNQGIVHADSVTSGGVLHIHADTVVEDSTTVGAAKWVVRDKGMTLLFSASATNLNGDFHTIGCGGLHIEANVKTCGTFHWDGWLQVVANTYFAYVGFNGHNTCSDPGTPPNQDPPNCAGPYVVSGYLEQQCGPTACP